MKVLLILVLLIILSVEPVLAKGSSGGRSGGFRSVPHVNVIKVNKVPAVVPVKQNVQTQKQKTSVNKNGKPNNGTPLQNRGTSWNPFASNFWLWVTIFGVGAHVASNDAKSATMSSTLTPTGGSR